MFSAAAAFLVAGANAGHGTGLLNPRPGLARATGPAATAGAVLILVLVARAHRGPAPQAALLGIASGIGDGPAGRAAARDS